MLGRFMIVLVVLCSLLSLPVTASIINDPVIRTFSSPLVFEPRGDVTIDLNPTGIAYGHELLWTANTTGTNYEESVPTVANGVAYIGSCATHGDGHDTLFAVDIHSGEILWSYPTGPGYVGPVVDDERVYFGTDTHGYYPDNEYLYAFNRTTGEKLWDLKIYAGIAESIQYDETYLYFASSVGLVYALYKTNGSIRWTHNLGSGVEVVTKPLLKDGMFYTATFEGFGYGQLYKLAISDGHEVWHIDLPGGPWDNSITTDGQGRLFLAPYGSSSLLAYRESNGSFLWQYPLHSNSLSFNAYHNGVVYIADTDGYVYALTASTGQLFWETKIGGVCDISSPTLSGGLIFIGTRDGPDGAYYALNETTGVILWRYSIGASVTCPPSIVQGMMLCGSDGWNMYAFDIGEGSGEWRFHRYDTWNTAYSPVGLTTWEYVEAACTTDQDLITCVVTNSYDHLVKNITLRAPFSAYWYSASGELLKEGSTTFTIPQMVSEETLTVLITNEPLFQVTITKPEKAIYLFNKKIIPFFFPVVIGRIDVEVAVRVNESGCDKVEFYVDDELQAIDTTPPYSVQWGQPSLGFHRLKVVAYQNTTWVNAESTVLKIL